MPPGKVLVLEQMWQKRMVRVSRKPCLMAAAAAGKGALPKSFDDVREGAVLTGYVGSVTSDAVYVRFLAGLTGGYTTEVLAAQLLYGGVSSVSAVFHSIHASLVFAMVGMPSCPRFYVATMVG